MVRCGARSVARFWVRSSTAEAIRALAREAATHVRPAVHKEVTPAVVFPFATARTEACRAFDQHDRPWDFRSRPAERTEAFRVAVWNSRFAEPLSDAAAVLSLAVRAFGFPSRSEEHMAVFLPRALDHASFQDGRRHRYHAGGPWYEQRVRPR